jgi:adenine deaminase
MERGELAYSSRGAEPCDLLLTNARMVNVFSGDIVATSVAVAGGRILGFGEYPARRTVDLQGRFMAPGFIDSHVHIESSMACVTEFARSVVALGTTAVVADPHEIANVLGAEGIRYMLRSAEGQPLNVYYALPSCVPATDLETAGAQLRAADLEAFLTHPRVVALGEMMNYPGVLAADPQVMKKIAAARRSGKPVDGHAPGLSGPSLMAYVGAGITSDHECTTAAEALEKLAAGMHIMIRQGTAARNQHDLLPIISPRTCRRLMWCTDDRHPHDLVGEGHIDSILRAAVRGGVDPLIAIRMATLNPAERFGLHHLGAIAPGRQADLVVFADVRNPRAEEVYVRGVLVAKDGQPVQGLSRPAPVPVPASMRVDPYRLDFRVRCESRVVRIIEAIPDQIITRQVQEAAPESNGFLISDPRRDLLKLAVVERHTGRGRLAVGMVRGLGLKHGALASSVSHDSHNIIVTGVSDEDMRAAVAAVVDQGGGLAAAAGGQAAARLPLPVGGLMSTEPVAVVSAAMHRLVTVARDWGSPLKDPFMTLSFLALPVIPELKLTDRGLVDVRQFHHVPLFV